uniref:Uncharacterized protein n=1 Tax=Xiphophorus maculatus TaxID=8083 RepID=A0A3B5QMT6_XIPMA
MTPSGYRSLKRATTSGVILDRAPELLHDGLLLGYKNKIKALTMRLLWSLACLFGGFLKYLTQLLTFLLCCSLVDCWFRRLSISMSM